MHEFGVGHTSLGSLALELIDRLSLESAISVYIEWSVQYEDIINEVTVRDRLSQNFPRRKML